MSASDLIKRGEAYILRTCNADMTSHGGFVWPRSGMVEAPDWRPDNECGRGLHGFLWGEGDGELASWDLDAVWIVAKVSEWIDLEGKVKAPRAEVVFTGCRRTATQSIISLGARGAVIGSTLTGRDGSKLTGGYGSTLTGGDRCTLTGGGYSKLTGGDRSALTGGDCSTLTAGDYSALTAGYGSTLTGGYRSTLTGGDRSALTTGTDSTLTAGYGSTLTAGDGSTLTGGRYSTLTAGCGSTLTAGCGSTLTAGYGSTLTGGYGSTLTAGGQSALIFWYWRDDRQRAFTAYTGEGGIMSNRAYRFTNGKLHLIEEEE